VLRVAHKNNEIKINKSKKKENVSETRKDNSAIGGEMRDGSRQQCTKCPAKSSIDERGRVVVSVCVNAIR
jgi:hypothetical protein